MTRADPLTIVSAAAALRDRRASIRELTDDTLAWVKRANSSLNAFLTITEDSARERANRLDELRERGIVTGPMLGVPIAHKDCIDTQGIRTTHGSRIFADHVPDHDARVVTQLNETGAVTIGKTGLHEFTYGITSANPHYGPVRNPWDLSRVAGGSSGGSAAAVAAGLLPMATGTDTGGSIRVPASFCGCVGLKPTYGAVSRKGVMPLGLTQDHVGPMTRTVRDAAVAFYAMADLLNGYVPPRKVEVGELRIGVPENYFFERLEPDVRFQVRHAVQTLAALGAKVKEVRVPDVDPLIAVARTVLLSEAASVLGRWADRREDFGADVLAMIDMGRLLPATDYLNAQRLRKVLAREFATVWNGFDLLITPATATTAFTVEDAQNPASKVVIDGVEEDPRSAATRLVRPFNALGWPALVLPCGFSTDGLPVGVQLVAPPNREDLLFQAGAALEDELGLTGRLPDLG